MKNASQKGFSLIELLIVIVVIGIIAAIGVPSLKKAKSAAENASIYATMRTMASSQLSFYTNNSRYGTLSELSSLDPGKFGTISGNNLIRGNFTLDMGAVTATDPSLKNNFTITATKAAISGDLPYQIAVSSTGEIVQLNP